MIPTGHVRKIDHVGRLVLPAEVLRKLGIAVGDSLEFLVHGGDVVLRKYTPGCVFCASVSELEQYRGKWVCGECLRSLPCR